MTKTKAFLVLIAVVFGSAAHATTNCLDTPQCTKEISSDKKAKVCADSITTSCLCEELSCHKSKVAKKCPTGWQALGKTVSGEQCCHDMKSQCDTIPKKPSTSSLEQSVPPMYTTEELIKSVTNQEVFYGVFDSKSFSPEAGRRTAAVAKLDVCFGSSTVDSLNNISADEYQKFSQCQNYCEMPQMNKNCRINKNEACLDRCACMWGQGYKDCKSM